MIGQVLEEETTDLYLPELRVIERRPGPEKRSPGPLPVPPLHQPAHLGLLLLLGLRSELFLCRNPGAVLDRAQFELEHKQPQVVITEVVKVPVQVDIPASHPVILDNRDHRKPRLLRTNPRQVLHRPFVPRIQIVHRPRRWRPQHRRRTRVVAQRPEQIRTAVDKLG